jgi:hypothetical protein
MKDNTFDKAGVKIPEKSRRVVLCSHRKKIFKKIDKKTLEKLDTSYRNLQLKQYKTFMGYLSKI